MLRASGGSGYGRRRTAEARGVADPDAMGALEQMLAVVGGKVDQEQVAPLGRARTRRRFEPRATPKTRTFRVVLLK